MQTLKLGMVTFTARPIGPLLEVTTETSDDGPFFLSVAEWCSLNAINDVLAAADVVHVRLRAALKEALSLAGVPERNQDDNWHERYQVLGQFLRGEREGL